MTENESRRGPATAGGRQPHQSSEQYGPAGAGSSPFAAGQGHPQGVGGGPVGQAGVRGGQETAASAQQAGPSNAQPSSGAQATGPGAARVPQTGAVAQPGPNTAPLPNPHAAQAQTGIPRRQPNTPRHEPGAPHNPPGTPHQETGTPHYRPSTPQHETGAPQHQPSTPRNETSAPQQPGAAPNEANTPQQQPSTPQQLPGTAHHQPGNPHYGPMPQPVQPPAALAGPRKRPGRLAALVGATALAAALLGGGAGAAIVGLTSGSSASPGTASSAATGQTISNTTASGDVSSVAAKVVPSVVQVNVTTGRGTAIGSGVILTADGRILTNAHVVQGAQTVTVTMSDGKKYQAGVVGSDTKSDIAVLQAQGASGLTAATLGDSSKLAVGQQVIAIGSPGGLQNTVTTGIVSALNRPLSDVGGGDGGQQNSPFGRQTSNVTSGPSYTAIQTDASINQGNSGGALVDGQGQVIGINSALYSPDSSAGSVGIGFAIPINDAKKIVDQIVNG
ncbi:Trypsin-like peptidase domain-containing protein [Amycolatopsis rubida]|uniref:Trypsin-like peptidase domain-containing protein n=1 Tax=Amycolatopsis rubida TaxID=112413 RepID=A0A1I5ZA25_9PSEU|nr:Trypsin-like peptidase domain-containing protein [Amycolatopsis rubida]